MYILAASEITANGGGQVGFGVRRDVEGGREVKDPRLKAFFAPQASRLPPNEASGMQYVDDKCLKARIGQPENGEAQTKSTSGCFDRTFKRNRLRIWDDRLN